MQMLFGQRTRFADTVSLAAVWTKRKLSTDGFIALSISAFGHYIVQDTFGIVLWGKRGGVPNRQDRTSTGLMVTKVSN